MLAQLKYIFGSKTKAQEIILLLNDAKEVIRQGFYQEELPKVEKFCEEQDIFLVKSRFKVLLADDTAYSNKGIRISEEDERPGMYFTYLSKDEEKAWLAAYYELMQNDKDLGLVLGYPECCVNFFCQNFSKDNPNPEHLPTNQWTNISKRDKDCVLLSHFPCNSDCEQSFALARRYYSVIEKVDKERARQLMDGLHIG